MLKLKTHNFYFITHNGIGIGAERIINLKTK